MTALSDLFSERLAESDLSIAQATFAGLAPLTADKTSGLWSGAPKQTAMRITYYGPAGKGSEFFRIRLLARAEGLSGQLAKPIRYLQPPESGVHAYLPRVKDTSWPTLMRDPSISLLITEGEIKALSATL